MINHLLNHILKTNHSEPVKNTISEIDFLHLYIPQGVSKISIAGSKSVCSYSCLVCTKLNFISINFKTYLSLHVSKFTVAVFVAALPYFHFFIPIIPTRKIHSQNESQFKNLFYHHRKIHR